MSSAAARTPIPASPPEPLGFGHIYIDRDGRHWVRTFHGVTLFRPWAHRSERKWWTELQHEETTT